MVNQDCVVRTLGSREAIRSLQVLLAEAGTVSRSEIARRVCEQFEFVDSLGRSQLASCQKALRGLDASGHIQLPAPQHGGRWPGQPARLGQAVPEPTGVPPRAGAVQGLTLTLVQTQLQRRVWNEIVAAEHPQGAVVHVGAQLRYLIESEHGILGAIGFAASALALAARDQWIGWSPAMRRKRLHRILGLSRFLIRPSVRCHCLASMVLGRALRRLPDDFRRRYGYRPALVETFCEARRHAGTCFRAANFTHIGDTAGRGRFAPRGQCVPHKHILVYPLRADWRSVLGTVEPLGAGEGLGLDVFAANELGGAPLGDLRLSKRLVRTAAMQAAAPSASIPGAAQGNRALVKGHYRFIDQPSTSAVTPENILHPHRERTLRRMQGESVVLCLQDGTDLNFAEHPGCSGLGLIAKRQASKAKREAKRKAKAKQEAQRRAGGQAKAKQEAQRKAGGQGPSADRQGTLGLHMHSTLAVNTEGIPLGVPQIQFESPDGKPQRRKPLAERKTMRWVRGVRECGRLAARLAGTRVVSVMDREGDVFELFAEVRRQPRVDLLVRARHNRSRGKGRLKLFDRIRAQAAQAKLKIDVARSSARRSTRNQKAKRLRKARQATAELRWRSVQVRDPNGRREPVRLQLVHVWERSDPGDSKPLEWYLLTTLEVTSSADAERVLDWYGLRWRIEDWHRILKTGCKAQYLGHRTGERIQRAVTIKAVIAWRLQAMTLLGRETPELPAETFYTELQMRVIRHFAARRGLASPDNLGVAVRTMAIMGGYLYRKRGPPAGPQKIWEGWICLTHMSDAYELRDHFERSRADSMAEP